MKYGTDFGYRGFTGHEHLDEFGLINMNARLYDPMLGRFLGMDPYVQLPDFTQNFNRYSYALNNPLVYVDPDGEFVLTTFLITVGIGTAMGAAMGGISYTVSTAISGQQWDAKQFWKTVGIGAISGAAGGGVGSVVSSALPATIGGFAGGAISGGAGGGVGGFIGGSLGSWANGGSFVEGLKAGGISLGFGLVSGAVIGGSVQGFISLAKGYNFWTGRPLIPDPAAIAAKATAEASNNAQARAIGNARTPGTEGPINPASQAATNAASPPTANAATQNGTNSVYQGADRAGNIKYVGITKRAPAVRFAEHLNSGTARSALEYEVVNGASGLSRINARILEQSLINQYGLRGNGGNLLNIRNSIAPQYWNQHGIIIKF